MAQGKQNLTEQVECHTEYDTAWGCHQRTWAAPFLSAQWQRGWIQHCPLLIQNCGQSVQGILYRESQRFRPLRWPATNLNWGRVNSSATFSRASPHLPPLRPVWWSPAKITTSPPSKKLRVISKFILKSSNVVRNTAHLLQDWSGANWEGGMLSLEFSLIGFLIVAQNGATSILRNHTDLGPLGRNTGRAK